MKPKPPRSPQSSPLPRVLVGALAIAFSAPAAEAARRPEVAVVGLHVPGQSVADAEVAGATVSAAFEDTAKVDVLELDELRLRLAGRESLVLEAAFLGPGRVRLEEGRVLYERADFEPAVEVLAQAVPELEDGSLGTTDIKDLLDALLLLGLAHFGLGEPDAAAEPWTRLVELDPNRRLDSVNYPPKVVQGFDAVRDRVRQRAPGTLIIDAPDGATVHVDGLRTDDRSLKLPPGEHFVVVQAEDGGRQADRVTVRTDRKVVWSAELQTRITSGSEGQADLLYQALGEHIDVDLILVGGALQGGRVGLQLFEPRTGTFSKPVELGASEDAVASLTDGLPTLANYLTDEGTIRTDRVARQAIAVDLSTNVLLTDLLLDPEPIAEIREVTKKTPWYVWAGVAAVAAGGAAGLAIALQPDDGPTTTTTTVEPGDEIDPDQGTVTVEFP